MLFPVGHFTSVSLAIHENLTLLGQLQGFTAERCPTYRGIDMSPIRIAGKTLFASALAFATGCASISNRHSPGEDDRDFGHSTDVVTGDELRRLARGKSLFDALEAVRPRFLHSRGSVSAVSIDGSPPTTDQSVLRSIPVADVKEARFTRGAGRTGVAAIQPDGSIVVGNVVVVATKKGSE